MTTINTTDCLVVGGGAVGLSLAYQLADDGLTVRLLERGEVGRQASWAGAGILPPGSWFSRHKALIPMAALSRELHAQWSSELFEATGIDDEFEVCGALYTTPEDLPLEDQRRQADRFSAWQEEGIPSHHLDSRQAASLEPGLTPTSAVHVPDEAQTRNPRRLQALRRACEARGVEIVTNAGVEQIEQDQNKIQSLSTPAERYVAGCYVLAAGAWTGPLAETLGVAVPTKPIRGQMVLLRTPERPFQHITHQGGLYLVPRRDGRVLVGSTVEDVGYNANTNPADIKNLVSRARRLAPCLSQAEIETSWAGLRPASEDGLPMIGRLPGFANGWIAGGHFRSGLQFSPATAVALSQQMRGEPTAFDLSAFDPARLTNHGLATAV